MTRFIPGLRELGVGGCKFGRAFQACQNGRRHTGEKLEALGVLLRKLFLGVVAVDRQRTHKSTLVNEWRGYGGGDLKLCTGRVHKVALVTVGPVGRAVLYGATAHA